MTHGISPGFVCFEETQDLEFLGRALEKGVAQVLEASLSLDSTGCIRLRVNRRPVVTVTLGRVVASSLSVAEILWGRLAQCLDFMGSRRLGRLTFVLRFLFV